VTLRLMHRRDAMRRMKVDESVNGEEIRHGDICDCVEVSASEIAHPASMVAFMTINDRYDVHGTFPEKGREAQKDARV